jgi:hypothetical protein
MPVENLSAEISSLSPEQLKALKERLRKQRQQSTAEPIPRRIGFSPCPPSCNQSWLWSVDRLTNGNPAWNVFTGSHFVGPLNLGVLERSLNEVLKRHEVLRTTLCVVDGQVMQIIAPEQRIELPVVDLREVDEKDRPGAAQHYAGERYRQLFDLSVGPLIRPTLFRLGKEEYQLLVVMHHTITDWISFMLLNKELAIFYEAFSEGKQLTLPRLPIQYGDYAAWERAWLQSELASKQIAYWKEQLANAPYTSGLPCDYQRPPVRTYWGGRQRIELEREVSESLRRLSGSEAVTLFVTTMTILYALLNSYSSQQDIVIGTPVIGRKRSEIENSIGLFLNHLALRLDLSGDPTFRELLGRVRRVVMKGYEHQDLPFGKLVEEVNSVSDTSRNPLFQVMFFFLAVPTVSSFSNLTLKPFEAYAGTARYDLLVSLWDKTEGVAGFFEYNTALFSPETVAQMASRYKLLAAKAANHPDHRLSDLVRAAS